MHWIERTFEDKYERSVSSTSNSSNYEFIYDLIQGLNLLEQQTV